MVRVSSGLKNYLRCQSSDTEAELGLTQLGPDIWFTDKFVEKHTDNTTPGKNTIFCVLLNDASATFVIDGSEINLSVGKIVRFDGNKEHSVSIERKGRTAFIIWDIPIEISNEKIIKELLERVEELNNLHKS